MTANTPYSIETITTKDDTAICNIIQQVGKEYGAIGEGFGPSDDEVLAMSQHYTDNNKSRYLVAKIDNDIIGGCGIAPFNHSQTVCELKKLFLLPQSRGLGIGKALTLRCLDYAIEQQFSSCYLDTLSNMQSAIKLYKKLGFVHLDKPLAGTEHNGCDVWMQKTL